MDRDVWLMDINPPCLPGRGLGVIYVSIYVNIIVYTVKLFAVWKYSQKVVEYSSVDKLWSNHDESASIVTYCTVFRKGSGGKICI